MSVSFDEVIAASKSAIAELSAAWATIGVEEDVQKAEVTKLRDVIFACFDQRVAQEKERLVALEAEISASIAFASALRKELVDENLVSPLQDDTSMPLLARRDAVAEELEKLNALKAKWTAKLTSRMETLAALHAELDEPIPNSFDVAGQFTQLRMAEFDGHIVAARKEIANRRAAIATVVGEITQFWAELKEGARTELDRLVEAHVDDSSGIGVKADTVAALSSRATELQEEKEARLDQVRALGAAITVLWEELKIDDVERNEFLGQHQGLGRETVAACEAELQRMQALKKEKLSELVADARAQVITLWDELHAGPDERASMAEMSTPEDALEETTFSALQRKVATLEEKVGRFRPLLKKIRRREELLKEKVVYEALLADPSRLLSRRRGAAQMEEAKMGNRVTKRLPKLTAALKKEVRAWENEEGNAELWINGERFLEHMAQQEAEAAAAKNAKLDAKKAAKKKTQEEDLQHGSKPRKRRTTMMRSKVQGSKKKSAAARRNKEQRAANANVVGLKR